MAILAIGVIAVAAAGAFLLSELLSTPVTVGIDEERERDEEREEEPDQRNRPGTFGQLPPEFTAPCTDRVDPATLDNVVDPRSLSPADGPLLRVTERWVEFESTDGLRIPGLLMAPRKGGPYPGVVWVHGGVGDQVEPQVVEAVARNGYVVLGVDYRGSSGHGAELAGHPDIGQKDVDDVIAAGRYLAGLPEVEGRGVAVAGGSRGAAMAFLAVIREPAVFDAVGAFYPIVDWACALKVSGGRIGEEFFAAFGGTPDEVPEEYLDRSPYYLADEIGVPVYMAHGLRDRRPPPTETVKMAQVLEKEGVATEVRFYNGLSHGFLEREEPDSPLWADFFLFLDRTL